MDRLTQKELVDLPEIVEITQQDIDENYQIWVYYKAFGEKFLPDELKRQSLKELSVILTLNNLYETMLAQDAEDNKSD